MVSLFLLLTTNLASAQVRKHEILIGVRGFSVNSQRFEPGINNGFGFFAEYGRIIFPELKISWRTQIGIDYIPSCQDFLQCHSWWYRQPIRLSSYLDMTIFENEKHAFSFGLGGSVVFGEKYSRILVPSIPPLVIFIYDTHPATQYGMNSMISYKNKNLCERLRFRYGLDAFWKTQLHSLSVVFHLK